MTSTKFFATAALIAAFVAGSGSPAYSDQKRVARTETESKPIAPDNTPWFHSYEECMDFFMALGASFELADSMCMQETFIPAPPPTQPTILATN